jgi:hypothetical protein
MSESSERKQGEEMKESYWGTFRKFFVVLTGGLATVAGAGVLAPASVVNIYTPGGQHMSDVVSSINGDSLVLWTDVARGGYSFLRRFDGKGQPLDASDWFAGSGVSSAALDKVGNFALASVEPDGNGKSVFVTVYNRNGNVRIAKFKVNSMPSTNIGVGRISYSASGRLLVGWMALRPDGFYQIYAKTYSSNGTPTSLEIPVTPPSNVNALQDIRIDDSGNFAAVWMTVNADPDVYFQRLLRVRKPMQRWP